MRVLIKYTRKRNHYKMANYIWETEIKLNITEKDLQEGQIVNYNTGMCYSQLVKEIKGKQSADPNYLFTDVHFPPEQTSLVYSEQWRDHMPSNLIWKRTANIVQEKPTFLKDGFSREDVVQGALGNCYFLSAASALANRPKAMRTVVPSDQVSLSNNKYLGAFHFRFWQFGTWFDVVVDDWLPCLPDEGVAFSHSKDNNEFWISLLEKAYGKLYGSYEALIRGHTIDALVDLTGGVAVKYELRKPPLDLSVQMRKAVRNGSIVCLGKVGNKGYDYETGLQPLHSYSVTLAERIKDNKVKVDLYRVRNPWGMANYEWKLDWSDHSEKWDLVSSEDKKKLQYPAGDGEWYMSYDDIIKNFDNVTICTVGPDFDEDGVQTTKGYHYSYAKGSWITSVNSGGGFVNNSLHNFLCNPQYLIKASTPVPGNQCSLFIGLMQRYSRQQQEGRKQFVIGYRLYKVDDSLGQYLQDTKQKIPFSYHYQLVLLCACDEGRKMREVSTYYEVEGGKYYLYIPFTKYIGDKEDYLLRVYSEEPVEMDELH